MAKEAIQKLEEQLKCSVCLDTYTDPKLLQCFHVYCKQCLVKLVIRDQQGQLSLPCPICRQDIPIPDEGVAGLQSAFQTNELLEIYNDYLKVKSARPEGDAAHVSPPISTKKVQYCAEHDGKELELYCETCEECICLKCAFKGGKHHCHDSNTLEVVFEKYRGEITPSLKPMEKNLKTVNKALTQLDKQSEDISDQRAGIEESIHNTVRQLHEFINVRKTELISQLHQMTQGKLKDLAVQRNQMETTQAQLSSCLDFVNESLKTDSRGDVLKMKTAIVKKIKELTTLFQPHVLMPNTEADMNFIISPGVTAVCQNYGVVYTHAMPDPSQCYVTGKGLETAVVGKKSNVLLHAINYSGKPLKESIELLQCELVSELTGTIVRGSVERKGENQYEISYHPTIKGRHQLHIKVKDQHVRDSPFAVAVKLPVEKLGTPILTINRIECPWEVAINQRQEVVVTESGANSVSVFSPSGKRLRSFGTQGSGKGHFSEPRGVAIDGKGDILVVDRDNKSHHVQKFTVDGQFITVFDTKGNRPQLFDHPMSVAFNTINDKVYVGDSNHHIQVLNSDFTYSNIFGRHGSGKGQFDYPWGIACDSTGKVYVADRCNNRIQVFTSDGKFLRMFGTCGQGRGELNNPVGIAIDTDDVVYVSDSNHRISVFTSEGQFVTSFGRLGKVPGEFNNPHGIAVDNIGVVYVCDSSNNRVQVF